MRLTATADLTNGLVAYYPFNGNVNDQSGNGNNGAVYGASLCADRFGHTNSAYSFNGINNYIVLPPSSALNPPQLTVSAWINLSQYYPQNGQQGALIFSAYNGYLGGYFLFVDSDGKPDLRLHAPNYSGDAHSDTAIATSAWNHVAGTYDGNTWRIYVNRQLHGSQTTNISFNYWSGVSPTIGRASWYNGDYLSGDIDEVRIYNRALSAAEVQALYNVGSGQPALSNVRASQRAGANLVDVWYDLSGVSAPVFVSASISTNGGVSYSLQPANLAGDGVTAPVSSGTSLHLVWNAGVDWPGQYSTQMRVLVSVPASSGSAQANSPMFTLDTRSVPTGTITGLVQGNGTALANAQVRIDGTAFTTTTAANGTFTLTTVPAGSGYL